MTIRPDQDAADPRESTTGRDRNQLARFLPLAGAAFAVVSMAGNLTIGEFPDSDSPVGKLASYYAAHHATVERGGLLLGYASIFLALFGVAIWSRIRRSAASPILAAGMLIGTAVASYAAISGADQYYNLGAISTQANISPAALQALHIGGAVGGTGADGFLLLLPIAAAGILSGAIPRWLAWPALLLAIMHLTPLGFFAYLLFHAWAFIAGITMTVHPNTRTELVRT